MRIYENLAPLKFQWPTLYYCKLTELVSEGAHKLTLRYSQVSMGGGEAPVLDLRYSPR